MAYQQGYRPPSAQQQTAKRPSNQRPRQASARPQSRKRRGHPFRAFLSILLLALIVTVGVMVYIMYDAVASVEKQGTFYPGVNVDGYALNGVSPQEAYDFLLAKARSDLSSFSIVMNYGDSQWTIDAQTLGLTEALETAVLEQIQAAYAVGRDPNATFVERYQTIVSLRETPYMGYTTNIEKDTSRIDAIISEIQAAVYRPATDASWALDLERKNNAVVINSEINGQELDATAFKAQLTSLINNMESGTIQIEPTVLTPRITAASLEGQIALIGNYESSISSRSTADRNRNIERGCAAFHGKEVKPGEKVSFNSWVGPRTEKNGFFPAEEIVSGSYEMGYGGGICQVSSTLYNAVIQANLKVVDRSNHGIPVNYMEMGADATVADGRIDFVFENNTESSIYLVARLDAAKNACVVQIYGRPDPDGNTYRLRHELIETIPIPSPTKVPDYNETYVKYIGEEQQVTDGQEGYVVRTYLDTIAPNGNVIEYKELYVDTYKAQPPKIYTGVNRP